MKFYKNKDTKECIILKDDDTIPTGYIEVRAGEVDAALEKHVPVVEKSNDKIIVSVGSVEHPMTEEHYIMWIAVIDGDDIIKKDLNPTDKPVVEFEHTMGEVYAYCNLHGLWKSSI